MQDLSAAENNADTAKRPDLTTSPLLALIAFYKKRISPALPMSCRFYPACSDYCAEALVRYGTAKGLWLSLKRVLRCNRFFPGGIDPVP